MNTTREEALPDSRHLIISPQRFHRWGLTVALTSRLFSICPRVYKQKNTLVAVTAWRLRILTLGLLYRKVEVDPRKKVVRLKSRYLWLIPRQRKFKFSWIQAITYSYQDWAPGASWSWSHDSIDLYRVGLRLHGDRNVDIHLFFFYGDGAFTNNGPLPNWLYWENYLLDTVGTQQKESKAFVDLLGKLIGVEVIPG